MKPVAILQKIVDKDKKLRARDAMSGYTFAIKFVSDNDGFYNVVRLDFAKQTVYLKSFSKSEYEQASQVYAALEEQTRGDAQQDVVLVSAGELKTLKKAYPNYFLDLSLFIERLDVIVEQIGKTR